MKRVCILMIKLYQRFISGLKRTPTCRFYPTCSDYAIEAYEKHGFVGGTYLTVRRVLRCNPFCKCGIDRVPEKITLKKH